MNYTEWKPVHKNRKRVPGIYQSRKDPSRFLINASCGNVRKKRTIVIDALNDAERIEEAMSYRAEMKTDIKNGFFKNRRSVAEVFEFVMSFKADTRWTKMQKAVFSNHIERHIGAKPIAGVTAGHLDDIFFAIKDLKPRTRKNVSDLLKMIFRAAIDQKLIRETPMEARHSVKLSYLAQKKIILSAEKQYRAVYEAIGCLYSEYPVMQGIFLFGLLHGRRKTEVLRLCWEDIDLEERTYLIRAENSKISADLSFSLPEEIIVVLQKIGVEKSGYVFINESTGKPFTGLQRHIVRIRAASGFAQFSFHAMRNLLVSALAARGVSVTYLSSILGHVDAATIRRYLSMQRQEASKVVESTTKELLMEAPIQPP
jgi:integrase